MPIFTFTRRISRRTMKVTISDDFHDFCILICRWNRVATTSLTRDIAVQSSGTEKRLDDFTYLQSETNEEELETKASLRRQCCICRIIVTRMRITRVDLITIWIVTLRSIWQNFAADFLRFGKFLPQICESCGATYRRNYETFSAM